jgi:hypothetical protein
LSKVLDPRFRGDDRRGERAALRPGHGHYHWRVPDAVRHAMTHRRSGAVTKHGIGVLFDAVPGLQRTTALRSVLRCARDTGIATGVPRTRCGMQCVREVFDLLRATRSRPIA